MLSLYVNKFYNYRIEFTLTFDFDLRQSLMNIYFDIV